MKKSIAYFGISIVIAGILSAFTGIKVQKDVLNTIYTVAGVVFSVGMSIAISPKTEKVTNERNRKSIRTSYLAVRNSFMYLFGINTVLFIIAQAWDIPQLSSFLDILCVVFILMSIVFYICNFVKLYKLGEEIEDQILKETQTEDRDK